MRNNEQRFTLGLASLPSFGQARLKKLLALFGTSEALWTAAHRELLERGIPDNLASLFVTERAAVRLDEIEARCSKLGIDCLSFDDTRYPKLLKEIPDAPFGLFVRGTLPDDTTALAIVGTRRPTPYGTVVTRLLTAELVRAGLLTVSGLALGIDGLVHDTTLKEGGRTIAVLASGLDEIYPRAHTRLASAIVAHGGALISEFPLGTPALKHHFPIRNRIIAGLTRGVLVTEAPERSGALLTAKLGLEYNREVMSVPGPITSETSFGTNSLLRLGAIPVLRAQDVLDVFHLQENVQPTIPLGDLSEDERSILSCMTHTPTTVDQIFQMSRLEASVTNAALIRLQMKGWITQTDPLHYVRTR